MSYSPRATSFSLQALKNFQTKLCHINNHLSPRKYLRTWSNNNITVHFERCTLQSLNCKHNREWNQTNKKEATTKRLTKVLSDDAWVITWGSHCSAPSLATSLAAFATVPIEIRVSSVKARTELWADSWMLTSQLQLYGNWSLIIVNC